MAAASHPDCNALDRATTAQQLLALETRVTAGRIPGELGSGPVTANHGCLDGDCFLLRTDTGLGFFYRKVHGVTVEHSADADLSEESLWLNGSVYAAVACINGLMPIHASAVMHEGRVVAFTGPSGAGKSTLIAALAGYGLAMYADDTLVLDISDPERIIALPGHKRLKLTNEAIALTGTVAQEKVGTGIAKYYATAPGDTPASALRPLPLAELIFLDFGDTLALEAITGGARIARLGDDHYTTDLFLRARRMGRSDIFALRARLARQMAMSRLVRPHDLARFAASATLAAHHILQRPAMESPA